MQNEQRGFLIKKGSRYAIDHKKTSSIIINKLHVDFLLGCKSLFSGKLLDAGCGEKPYSLIYNDLVEESIGCDVPTCKHNQNCIDIFATIDKLPFLNEEFDTILCTNVLEHVANAEDGFAELSRILKKDGNIIISVPFLYPVHEAPYDFYRYTQYGIIHLLEINNFEVKKIVPWGGIGLEMVVFFNLFFNQILKINVITKINMYSQELFYKIYKKLFWKKIFHGRSSLSQVVTMGNFIVAQKK